MLTLRLLAFIALSQLTKSDNECLNGKDPETLTKKEILIEFSKGPCSPFIIVHGFLSSKLIVEIDCHELKTEHPDIFEVCGWNDCNKKSTEFWKSVPNKEYQVWIPGFTSPMDIFSFSEKSNLCWAKFMRQAYDFSKPLDQSILPTKGFKIKVFGSTEGTKDKLECGDGAIRDIFDSFIQTPGSKGFKNMINTLKKMGYIHGLTYQSIPYDFNIPMGANQLNFAFSDNIRRLNELTQKKVTIISHSFGGVNTLYQLNKMNLKDKESLVKVWVNIAAPFLGAIKNYKAIISGNSELSFFNHKIGLHLKPSLLASSSSVLMFLLISMDPFTQYKDAKWFKSIIKRMQYEEGLIPFELTDLKFLPKTEEKCNPANFNTFSQNCNFGFYNTTANYTVKIDQDEYRLIDTREMITKWNITDRATELYDISRNGIPIDLKNPEVPIISINMRNVLTDIRYTYGPDLRKYVDQDLFYIPDTEYGMGDGSVVSYSQYIALFKWAKEFQDKQEGAKPVKIVDLCSVYKNKYDPFDAINDDGEKILTDNEFFGISCNCINDKNPNSCNHASMIDETHVFRLLGNTLRANDVSFNLNYKEYVESLEDEYLQTITTECPQVQYN